MLTEKYGVDTPLLMEFYVKIDPCLWIFLRKIVRKPPFFLRKRPIFPAFKIIDPSLRKFIQNTPFFTENRPLPMKLEYCAVVTNHYVELFTHWLFKCEEPPVKQSITAIGCSMCEDPPTLSSIHNGEKYTNFQK